MYRALTTREGLSAWWTIDTQGHGKVGSVLQFRFGSLGGFDMRVLEGPEEWIGTKILRHEDWKDAGGFMHHCSTKWGTCLLSLKSSVERREGRPWPHDVKIDKWEVIAA